MMDVLILSDAVVDFICQKKTVKYKRFLCEGPMAFVVKVYI